MTRFALALSIMAIVLGVIAHPGDALAQAQRTWVSGTGDDAAPCSHTAPCKTFAGAISKTAAGGEIDCLDPGGFGSVIIVKSVTIDCTGTLGSVVSSFDGMLVKLAKSTDVVTIRGVTLNGGGGGANGIHFTQTGALNLDHLVIFGFAQNGVDFEPTSDASLFVSDVIAHDNGGAGALVKTVGDVNGKAVLIRATAQHNAGAGVMADGKGATIQIGAMAINGNATGVGVNNGGVVQSFGNNAISGNANDGTASLTPVPLH